MPPPVCQFCGQPSTVHLTDIVQKVKKESHLCEACARAKQVLPDAAGGQLNLQALVSLVLGPPPAEPGHEPAALLCPQCGLNYTEFRKHGRLGCPADYAAFKPALEPLLDKIHRATAHTGKSPRAAAADAAGDGAATARRAELTDLRDRLRQAVAAERYEEAAVLRDTIRQKEQGG